MSFLKFAALATLTLACLPVVMASALVTGEPFAWTPWVRI